MKRSGWIALAFCAAFALTPASAQNMSLRGPTWAQPLLATDVIPTTGGRAALAAEGIDLAVRVTIAPHRGGVARVIRFEESDEGATLRLRRLTGHPSTGWWLWGSDAPLLTTPAPALAQELAGLVRGAAGVSAGLGSNAESQTCPTGEQAYVELVVGSRSTSVTRACVTASDPVGRLITRLSEAAGWRTEEELHAAAIAEIMQTDRDFNAMAQSEGVAAAFARYADANAILIGQGAPIQGRAGIAAAYADWPEGAKLEWAPETGQVSSRGDMAWTWGRATFTPPGGPPRNSAYVSVWTRDWEGNWRFAFDAALAGGAAPN